ncbi:unnamed protein product [Meloidogyne enterolobii]|uniref:Uncharacterized protein n=1 Tax=Meloidogyne enterolobii TaxID=390850 RepID=A0ACB1A0S5_MELEN
MEIKFGFDLFGHSNMGNEYLNGTNSQLKIRSVSKTKIPHNERNYPNHIRPGMPIVVLIQANENNYSININEGDDIYYPFTIFPHWAINRVEVNFYFI